MAVLASSGAATTVAPPRAAADGVQVSGLDVKRYGATGDGSTDDTLAIHAARDAAGVGGKLLFPAGTYRVNKLAATIPNQSWLLDENAVIKMQTVARGDQGWCLRIFASGVTVIGGIFDAIDGTWHNGLVTGIICTADDVTFENVTVRNSPWHGISVFNHGGVSITGCTIINTYKDAIWCQNAEKPRVLGFRICDNMVDNSAASTTAGGIGIRAEDANVITRILVSGNTVVLPRNPPAQDTANLQFRKCDDFICANNTTFGGSLAITAPFATNATISKNLVRGFNWAGIEIPGDVNNVIVAGNRIDVAGQVARRGIVHSSGYITDLQIIDNVIDGFTTDSSFAISLEGKQAARVTISKNLVNSASDNSVGVLFNSPATEVTISTNVFDGAYFANSQGVQFIKDTHGATISENHFYNLSTAAVRLGPSHIASYDHINVAGNLVVNSGSTLLNSTWKSAVVGPSVIVQD